MYVPREDPEVVCNFARNGARHGTGLGTDNDTGLTVQGTLYTSYRRLGDTRHIACTATDSETDD